MESTAHRARTGHSSPNGEPLLGGGFNTCRHFDRRLGRESEAKCTTISIAGSESVVGKEAASIAGRFGCKSWCEPFAETIGSKIEAGLSAQRIHQDLVEEKGFAGSYQSVGRFARRLKQRQPQRVWRMEGEPGGRDAG
jgi:hypothetical protein